MIFALSKFLLLMVAFGFCCLQDNAFVLPKNNGRHAFSSIHRQHVVRSISEQLFLSRTPTTTTTAIKLWNKNDKKKGGLEEGMRNKLVTESIAPWRTIRLFLYGALGSGAFVGGLINTSGAIAQSANPNFNLHTELTNIVIDFGAVILFAVLAKFDLDKQSELQTQVDEKIQRKKEMKQLSKGMKEREKLLGTLLLEFRVSVEDDTTQLAKVSDLQLGAKQHMIIVAGPKKVCKDALIGANLQKMDFAMSDILVVPYETDLDPTERLTRPEGKGFGDRPSYETQPYVARPASEDWDDFIRQEMADAVKQNGELVKKDGIAIVVANNGKTIRRGVGTVPWRQIVDELRDVEIPDRKKDTPLPWL